MHKGRFVRRLQNIDSSFALNLYPETDLEYLKLETFTGDMARYKKESIEEYLLSIIKVCKCALRCVENMEAAAKERVQSGCNPQ